MEVAVLKLFERRQLIARFHDGFEALIWLYEVDSSKAGRELVYDIVTVKQWGTRTPVADAAEQAVVGSAAAIASVELVIE